MTIETGTVDSFSILRNLFGDNRAEWPPERFRELFVAPSYFKKLETMRPCILVGGRGTGKTTALRSLRYDATLERLEASNLGFGEQEHLGVFIRMNKNRTHAFQGGSLGADDWRKAFAHYFNLLACIELAELTTWLEKRTGEKLSDESLGRVCEDLALPRVASSAELRSSLKQAVSVLQLFVNNPTQAPRPQFSMQEAPLRTFVEVLHETDGLTEKRIIFCCIDEYENLLEDQQAILNTYIKHAEPPLSYKVGVRNNGITTYRTLEGADLLRTPDDFERVDIAQEGFEHFAGAVARLRLTRAQQRGVRVPDTLEKLLNELTFAQEAELLGAGNVAHDVMEELHDEPLLHKAFSARAVSETYFLKFWAESEHTDVKTLARDWLRNEEAWRNRLNNYGYASLFWLSHGRKGARIRKYYCGARIFFTLPAGNIRYFLELIDSAIALELDSQPDAERELITIDPQNQTIAARQVGQRRLEQLDGLGDHGNELKRLVLAIGKVFFELARKPLGHSPEVTSFVVAGAGERLDRVLALLRDGVAHLAFVATPRTKATNNNEMRDDEYRLHPIFCAFFEISHRRKRRTTFQAEELFKVLNQPSKAISQLLAGEEQSGEAELPEQLALFANFFEGGDDK